MFDRTMHECNMVAMLWHVKYLRLFQVAHDSCHRDVTCVYAQAAVDEARKCDVSRRESGGDSAVVPLLAMIDSVIGMVCTMC
jgi:hypothetical protein